MIKINKKIINFHLASIKNFLIEKLKKLMRSLIIILFDKQINNPYKAEIKNILIINWNGMIGDAIISSCLISEIKSKSDIKIHVITTKSIAHIYLEYFKVDSVYIVKNKFTLKELYIAAKIHKFCDTIIPLIGKLQWKDIFFAGLVRPDNFLSTDDSLKMSNFKLEKEVEKKSIDETFRIILKKILPSSACDSKYIIPDEKIKFDEPGYILFNPFASREDKSLTIQRSASILNYLSDLIPDKKIYILYSPTTLSLAKDILQNLSCSNIALPSNISSIERAISYVRNAEYVISVDTSIVHIAYGLGVRTIAIYQITEYFNQWLPPKTDYIEFVFSKAKIEYRKKNMNFFCNSEIKFALNRLKNSLKLSDQLNVFLYFDKPLNDMPSSHRMNVLNFYSRLCKGTFRIILTNLSKESDDYIENYVPLPGYFNQIENKILIKSSVPGNLSDIIRLRLLENYGGAYFDTSTIFLKNCISQLDLYNSLINSPEKNFAGYSNVTFVRKNPDRSDYFENGIDGIELGLIYARKNSALLKLFNSEIDNYWEWKVSSKSYKEYPPFINAQLKDVSFLNEYHIHYSIYHLIITRDPSLIKHIVTQSIHMKGKENSKLNGPNTLTDMFCRGESAYEPGNSQKLLDCFNDVILKSFDGTLTTLEDRVKIVEGMELISIPGYMRKSLEREFLTDLDYFNKHSLYKHILKEYTCNKF